MTELRILSNSAQKTYRRCHRLYQYKYIYLREPNVERAAPLRFGSLVHAGLEHWWISTPDRALANGINAMLEYAGEEGCDDYELAKAEAMLTVYDSMWQDESYHVMGVETEFELPLINPASGRPSRTFKRGGKLDAFVCDANGDCWVVEHKTTSEDISQGSAYWQCLRMDTQVSTYLDAAEQAFGVPIAGAIYDVLAKPGLKPKMATPHHKRKFKKDGTLYANMRDVDETPDEYKQRLIEEMAGKYDQYFVRGTVVRMQRETEEARKDAWLTATSIRESIANDAWPRNPDACRAFNRLCEYFDVCTGAASLDDDSKFRDKEANPELGGTNGNDETAEAAPF